MGFKLAYPVAVPGCTGKIRAFTQDYETVFPWMRDHGYEGVELLIRDAACVDRGLLDDCLSRYGLTVAAIGTSPMQGMDHLFLLNPDPENRRKARERMSGLLKLCAYYRAPALVGKYRGTVSDDAGCTRKDLELVMRDVCREAAGAGVSVLLEPQNPTNINNLNTVPETLAWIRELGEDNLGILADIYHMGITEMSIAESLRSAKDRIGFIHMSDSDRRTPGQGELPLTEICRALCEMPYEGYVSLEIDQKPDSFGASAESASFLQRQL